MSANDISRKEFLRIVGGAALAPLVPSGWCAGASTDVPNVILIISDDQTFGELGVLNPGLKTPNLDRLARTGVRFTNAFVNTSICAPGRACLLTGLYSRQNGVTDNFHVPRRPDSLIPYLHRAGYTTGICGKWHYQLLPDVSDFGFDWKGSLLPGASLFEHPVFVYAPGGRDARPAKVTKEEGDMRFTDTAVSFLESHKDKPFFLWLGYTTPHVPMLMPDKFRHMYDPQDIRLPANYVATGDCKGLRASSTDGSVYGGGFAAYEGTKDIRQFTALYHGMVSYMDEQIGRLLDTLRRLELSDNTLVIFVGDNGFMLGGQGCAGKGLLYEESIKVPLIFNWPQRIKPRVVDDLVCQTDILPTVMDIAKIRTPGGLAGRSLLPLLEARHTAWRDHVFCELYPQKWRAVRSREWKYIYTPQLGDELYHIAADPLELKNLSGEQRHRAILQDLKQRWDAWEKDIGVARSGQEEPGNYVAMMEKERNRCVRLIEDNDYDPQILLDLGGPAAFAWMRLLKAEGKLSDELIALADRLKRMPIAELMHSPEAKAPMTEALRELVRCELRR